MLFKTIIRRHWRTFLYSYTVTYQLVIKRPLNLPCSIAMININIDLTLILMWIGDWYIHHPGGHLITGRQVFLNHSINTNQLGFNFNSKLQLRNSTWKFNSNSNPILKSSFKIQFKLNSDSNPIFKFPTPKMNWIEFKFNSKSTLTSKLNSNSNPIRIPIQFEFQSNFKIQLRIPIQF